MIWTIEQIYDKFLVSSGVNTDTRTIKQDQFFVAIKGDHFNGNAYADEALLKGALFALVDEAKYATSDQHILVENTLQTLQDLASFHRQMLEIPVIGITGSNGKTTTKELTAEVLSMKYRVFATKGNLNNHIGVPLSVLSIQPHHDIAIIEMGANHLHEIAQLSAICNPTHAIITNIGTAHLEGFGSQENIRKGKTELYQQLKQTGGTVFVHSLDDILMQDSEGLSRITYGGNTDQVQAHPISGHSTLHLHLSDQELEMTFSTHLFGEYNINNALAAAAIGKHFEVDFMSIVEAIQEYTPQNHRSQIVEQNGITYIVDAYNANISSMRVAIRDFAKLNSAHKIAILGSMLELGELEQQAHKEVVELTKQLKLTAYFVGKEFKSVAKTNVFNTVEELKQSLPSNQLKGATILLKGSRGVRLEKFMTE